GALVFDQPHLADAVLGADRTTMTDDQIMHDTVDLGALLAEAGHLPAIRTNEIIMQIAVAHVPERAGPYARIGALQSGVRFGEKLGDARYRHRDVMRQRAADSPLRLGQILAHTPKALRLRTGRRNHRIQN